MAPHRVDPIVDAEALEEAERRPSSTACSTRNSPLRWTSGALTMTTPSRNRMLAVGGALVVLGAAHDQFEHVVAEVDALGRAGRAAGQHLDGDPGRAAPTRGEGPAGAVDRDRSPSAPSAPRATAGNARPATNSRSSRLAERRRGRSSDDRSCAHPLGTAARVDGDNARAGARAGRATRPTRPGGSAAGGRRVRPRRGPSPGGHVDLFGRRRQVAPRGPLPVELQRRGGRVERDHRATAGRVKRSPSANLGGAVRRRSARRPRTMPIGLPRRVYMRPCSMAAR